MVEIQTQIYIVGGVAGGLILLTLIVALYLLKEVIRIRKHASKNTNTCNDVSSSGAKRRIVSPQVSKFKGIGKIGMQGIMDNVDVIGSGMDVAGDLIGDEHNISDLLQNEQAQAFAGKAFEYGRERYQRQESQNTTREHTPTPLASPNYQSNSSSQFRNYNFGNQKVAQWQRQERFVAQIPDNSSSLYKKQQQQEAWQIKKVPIDKNAKDYF